MTIALHPATPKPAKIEGRGGKSPSLGIREETIQGGFIPISPHQLVLAWWLYQAGHITRRQFRVYMAALEMAERRRLSNKAEDAVRPHYAIEELQHLVGGRGSETAAAELRADVRRLAALALVTIEKHRIDFATSIDQIRVDDTAGFYSLWQQLPNQQRSVPLPRRTVRALAGGFSRAVTGVMIAILLRGVFWHKQRGDYRTDHRTKLSWIAGVFGISRRAVTDARTRLIELGWLEPIECSQWELNKWGVRDRVRTDWTSVEQQPADPVESASPSPQNSGESASPLFNKPLHLSDESIKTRRLEATAPNPGGVSSETKRLGYGKDKTRPATTGRPSLKNIQPHHLRNTEDLLQIYGDAVNAGLVSGSEAGRLDFVSLAERARAQGNNPGGLLRWLLTNGKFERISQADEDAARDRLKQYDFGDCTWKKRQVDHVLDSRKTKLELTENERFVQVCLQTARQMRIADPFYIALEMKGWSRDEWDQKHRDYELRQVQRWQGNYE